MLFLLINRTPPDLTRSDYAELAGFARAFYASIPADVAIRGEWAAGDRTHNYTLLEPPDIDTVRRIQVPFARCTDTTIAPVTAIEAWTAS